MKAGEEAGKGFKESFGGAVNGLAAGFVGLEVFDFIKESIDAGREAARAIRQTETVIASTGSAAHVTAEDVKGLVESVGEYDGVQSDIVRTGANLLLTFT